MIALYKYEPPLETVKNKTIAAMNTDVAKKIDTILIGHDCVVALYDGFVMFLDATEWAKRSSVIALEVENVGMAKVMVGAYPSSTAHRAPNTLNT